ncbi:MAG TPA: NAD(P)/FAD-dependent oxidoreductase [Candidatus Marinimicrobia bacterium]|nr:NAD(P)/FAD-dependent oxidoreductase [Candidatus Neomarinimicrobiota bacterium]
MKRLLILGAGTAGTIMANRLNRKLDRREWIITLVDQHSQHYYQPGFLFIPFEMYTVADVTRARTDFLPKQIEYIQEEIELIETDKNRVKLHNGEILEYQILVIATGTDIVPAEVGGLLDNGWGENAFDFYTIEGAQALAQRLKDWKGGKLVVHIAEMPIKCPVAPLEFTFLADWYFTRKGIRDDVELTYVTPLSGAFTRPRASAVLDHLLEQKNVKLVPDFNIMTVDGTAQKLVSYDEKKVEYDLLVSIPTNMGAGVIERSGLGDELNFVPTQKHTLQSKAYENIFVLGDATDLPSSKAGSVAHFQAEILTENILLFIKNRPLKEEFDGHANCFIESGFGKGFLIDFNYDIEPVEGKFPLPVIGPMALLQESRMNHLGKLAFKWIYWHVLLRGLPIPLVTAKMSTLGKKI